MPNLPPWMRRPDEPTPPERTNPFHPDNWQPPETPWFEQASSPATEGPPPKDFRRGFQPTTQTPRVQPSPLDQFQPDRLSGEERSLLDLNLRFARPSTQGPSREQIAEERGFPASPLEFQPATAEGPEPQPQGREGFGITELPEEPRERPEITMDELRQVYDAGPPVEEEEKAPWLPTIGPMLYQPADQETEQPILNVLSGRYRNRAQQAMGADKPWASVRNERLAEAAEAGYWPLAQELIFDPLVDAGQTLLTRNLPAAEDRETVVERAVEQGVPEGAARKWASRGALQPERPFIAEWAVDKYGDNQDTQRAINAAGVLYFSGPDAQKQVVDRVMHGDSPWVATEGYHVDVSDPSPKDKWVFSRYINAVREMEGDEAAEEARQEVHETGYIPGETRLGSQLLGEVIFDPLDWVVGGAGLVVDALKGAARVDDVSRATRALLSAEDEAVGVLGRLDNVRKMLDDVPEDAGVLRKLIGLTPETQAHRMATNTHMAVSLVTEQVDNAADARGAIKAAAQNPKALNLGRVTTSSHYEEYVRPVMQRVIKDLDDGRKFPSLAAAEGKDVQKAFPELVEQFPELENLKKGQFNPAMFMRDLDLAVMSAADELAEVPTMGRFGELARGYKQLVSEFYLRTPGYIVRNTLSDLGTMWVDGVRFDESLDDMYDLIDRIGTAPPRVAQEIEGGAEVMIGESQLPWIFGRVSEAFGEISRHGGLGDARSLLGEEPRYAYTLARKYQSLWNDAWNPTISDDLSRQLGPELTDVVRTRLANAVNFDELDAVKDLVRAEAAGELSARDLISVRRYLDNPTDLPASTMARLEDALRNEVETADDVERVVARFRDEIEEFVGKSLSEDPQIPRALREIGDDIRDLSEEAIELEEIGRRAGMSDDRIAEAVEAVQRRTQQALGNYDQQKVEFAQQAARMENRGAAAPIIQMAYNDVRKAKIMSRMARDAARMEAYEALEAGVDASRVWADYFQTVQRLVDDRWRQSNEALTWGTRALNRVAGGQPLDAALEGRKLADEVDQAVDMYADMIRTVKKNLAAEQKYGVEVRQFNARLARNRMSIDKAQEFAWYALSENPSPAAFDYVYAAEDQVRDLARAAAYEHSQVRQQFLTGALTRDEYAAQADEIWDSFFLGASVRYQQATHQVMGGATPQVPDFLNEAAERAGVELNDLAGLETDDWRKIADELDFLRDVRAREQGGYFQQIGEQAVEQMGYRHPNHVANALALELDDYETGDDVREALASGELDLEDVWQTLWEHQVGRGRVGEAGGLPEDVARLATEHPSVKQGVQVAIDDGAGGVTRLQYMPAGEGEYDLWTLNEPTLALQLTPKPTKYIQNHGQHVRVSEEKMREVLEQADEIWRVPSGAVSEAGEALRIRLPASTEDYARNLLAEETGMFDVDDIEDFGPEDWRLVADYAEQESNELLELGTEAGRRASAERAAARQPEMRRAFGEWQQQYRGRYSRSWIEDQIGELAKESKAEAEPVMDWALREAGFEPEELAGLSDDEMWRRRHKARLLAEVARGELLKTPSGKISKIDDIPVAKRQELIEAVSSRLQEEAFGVLQEPEAHIAYELERMADEARFRAEALEAGAPLALRQPARYTPEGFPTISEEGLEIGARLPGEPFVPPRPTLPEVQPPLPEDEIWQWLISAENQADLLEKVPHSLSDAHPAALSGESMDKLSKLVELMGNHEPPTMGHAAKFHGKWGVEALDQVEQGVKADLPRLGAVADRPVQGGAAEALQEFIDELRPQMAEQRLVTSHLAKAEADFSLLDYRNRRGVDNLLSSIFTYHYWQTRSAKNWLMRMLQKPGIMAKYMRYNRTMEKVNERAGRPARFEGSIPIPAKWLPDWMGDHLYANPARTMIPFTSLAYTDFNDVEESRNALDYAYRVSRNFGLRLHMPLELGLLMSGAAGEGRRAIGMLTPQSSAIRGTTALMRGAGADVIPPQGVNVEAPIKRALSTSTMEMWDPYRIADELEAHVQDNPDDVEAAAVAMVLLRRVTDQELTMNEATGVRPGVLTTKRAGERRVPAIERLQEELGLTDDEMLRAQEVLARGVTRGMSRRGVSQMGSFMGLPLQIYSRGEQTANEQLQEKFAQTYSPLTGLGSREELEAWRERNPDDFVSWMKGYFVPKAQGEFGADWEPAEIFAFKQYQAQNEQITQDTQQALAEQIREEPWNTEAVREIRAQGHELRAELRRQAFGEEASDEVYLSSTYGATPEEVAQIRRDDLLYEVSSNKPYPDDFEDEEGEVNWEAFEEAEQEYIENLSTNLMANPTVMALTDEMGAETVRRLLNNVTLDDVDEYHKRNDTPMEALQQTWMDEVYRPAWDKYHDSVDGGMDKSEAYETYIEPVGAMGAESLIPEVRSAYGNRWSKEELREAYEGIRFPNLDEATTRRKPEEEQAMIRGKNAFWDFYNEELPPGKLSRGIKNHPLIETILDRDTRNAASAEGYEMALRLMQDWKAENESDEWGTPEDWAKAREQQEQFDEWVQEKIPNIDELLGEYYDLSVTERGDFRDEHPEIDRYYDLREQWGRNHPEYAYFYLGSSGGGGTSAGGSSGGRSYGRSYGGGGGGGGGVSIRSWDDFMRAATPEAVQQALRGEPGQALKELHSQIGWGSLGRWVTYLQQLYRSQFKATTRPPRVQYAHWLSGVRRS